MGLTTRDIQVINFLESTRLIMTSDQIARYFYRTKTEQTTHSIINIANTRLKVMIKTRNLKRVREFNNQSYIYYQQKKAPIRSQHKLIMSEFIVKLKESGFTINKVELEYKALQQDYHLRPDMRLELEYYNLKFVAIVEVDHTKTFTNEEKYRRLLKNRATDPIVQEALTRNCMLISVCDKKPDMKGVQWIKTDMSNFSKFKYDFDRMLEGCVLQNSTK